MESSAISAWLFEHDLDVKARVSRSFALRFEGLTQESKYVQTLSDAATQDRVEAQIRKVEREALALRHIPMHL